LKVLLAVRKPVVNIAVEAARKAAHVIVRQFGRGEAVKFTEKARMEFASEVDAAAEKEIIKVIRKAYPDHAILAEESGASGQSRFTWVIDPLDGTSNFLRNLPHYSISIALMEDGVVQHGVVYDPLRDELFTASKGGGAFLNDRRMRVSNRGGLPGALIGTGFPPRQRKHLPQQMRIIKLLLEEAEDLRRSGSAALDLSYVAAGRMDGFFEYGLKAWDMAAGILLIKEAGGVVMDFNGRDDFLTSGNLVAGNLKVAAAISTRIKAVISKPKEPA
jgi:myo-inositol-1(or 4)-monophosphatase